MILEPVLQQQRKHGSSVLLMLLYLFLLSTIVGTLVVEARSPPEQEVLQPARQATAGGIDRNKLYYKVGDAIPVSCLNRTLDTGEHITDEQGQLQYIPFPVCNETGQPLELLYGVEKEINCTIDSISDPLFHQLEFYVHNDAPLTCRIPIRPLRSEPISAGNTPGEVTKGPSTSRNSDYIPFIVVLTGTLQLSHLHAANHLNVLIHTTPDPTSISSSSSSIFSIFSPFSSSPSASKTSILDAATAYSISSTTRTTKIVIGDALPLRFRVRWFPTPALPPGWSGFGGHIHLSTLGYCLLSALSSAALCLSYFRGIELPRRIKSHRRSALGGEGTRYNGWGYGVAKKE